MKIKYLFIACISILIGSIIGLLPAIYNTFPFVNSDTGSYIAYTNIDGSPIDRSVFYSYFISLTSAKLSLKLFIIVQSLVGSLLIFSLLKTIYLGIRLA